ncbi:Uncharacterized protein GBIM_04130 [Gryllus bimaculatus]|nr:Uncharacterized protein GBIM_04130 [Gryllus bimaculatus]
MLISPLMGPIMAFTLGTLGRERRLQRRGVRVEVLGLAGCLLLGFLFGLAAAGVAGGAPPSWPTREMRARGELHAVWVGALVALLSGAAVALATLGGYTASLVGVAISAALLPPAINAGLLWSLACASLLTRRDATALAEAAADAVDAMNGTATLMEAPVLPPAPTLGNREVLSVAADLAMQGALSVCLTLLNILCIFVAAMIVLKAKQVSPTAEDRLLLCLDPELPASPAASNNCRRRRHWSMAQPPQLSRRVSLLVQQASGGCDTCTRTWSPGARPSRSSLQDLRSLYLSTLGPASGSVDTPSPPVQPPPQAPRPPAALHSPT